MNSPLTPSETSLGASLVRAAMERHGLPKYRHSAWLAERAGLSYSQAHRRMSGTAAWTVEEMAQVAALLGESLAELISGGHATGGVKGRLSVQSPVNLECEIWLGERLKQPAPSSLVAIQSPTGWLVTAARDVKEGVAYAVNRIEAHPSSTSRHRIAVLDDDRHLADSISEGLTLIGFEAEAFHDARSLLESAQASGFAAYVIDWVLGDTSAASLVESLRGLGAVGPILVLTGQVSSGTASEDDIAEAIKRHGLLFSEKPLRISILAAALTSALAAQ